MLQRCFSARGFGRQNLTHPSRSTQTALRRRGAGCHDPAGGVPRFERRPRVIALMGADQLATRGLHRLLLALLASIVLLHGRSRYGCPTRRTKLSSATPRQTGSR